MTRRLLVVVPLLCLSLLVCVLTYALTWRQGLHELRGNAGARVERYAGNLKSTVDRYEFLPYLVATHPFIHQLLASPADAASVRRANEYLDDVNRRARAAVTYVIGRSGVALASSNWQASDSFVGREYQFRPYFRDAIAGGIGRFYGVGTAAGKPGYYVSQPVRDARGQIVGVVVVKLDLEWFQGIADGAEPLVVADEHGVVFLSSAPSWQYRSLAPLTPAISRALAASRQYYNQHITSLPLKTVRRLDADARIVSLSGRRYLAASRRLGEPDWTLIYFAPLDQVAASAVSATVAAAFACACVWLLLFYWRQRRLRARDLERGRARLQAAYAALNERVALRTADLRAANEQLQTEVQERTRAEAELRRAQDELVQASKLAALGQMAAGVTHELNQPLAALRSFSDNARVLLERGDTASASENLEAIAALTDRMGKITGQLRLFAGKPRSRDASANVRTAIDAALALLAARLPTVHVHVDAMPDDCQVMCDSLRLEQVLINLIGNAADAAQGAAQPRIDIGVSIESSVVRITVRDNGTGIAADAMPRLFEPFFTTKEGGRGMGLGLAISSRIAQEYGGQLGAANAHGGGAVFTLTLRRVGAQGGAGRHTEG